MDDLDAWKLAEELSVYQIALLMSGQNPSEILAFYDYWDADLKSSTLPYVSALKNAVRSKRLKFKEVQNHDQSDIDWHESTIEIESLIEWLKGRNAQDGFFLSNKEDFPAIADRTSPFYAPKLAAAVRAWTEVTSDPSSHSVKSPKQALEIWLRKHADEYGLTHKDGNPNEQGIEEISKVANWKPTGGVSPTPTYSNPPTPSAQKGRKVRGKPTHPKQNNNVPNDDDEDISF